MIFKYHNINLILCHYCEEIIHGRRSKRRLRGLMLLLLSFIVLVFFFKKKYCGINIQCQMQFQYD